MSKFIGLLNTFWSSEESGASDAWWFAMATGQLGTGSKDIGLTIWAVSSGDVGVAVVPEADTWAMLLAGLGLVGVAVKSRRG